MPSDIKIFPVKTTAQIEGVAHLAAPIWRQHFTPIIGEVQVAYMLKHFQSAQAIQQQISDEGVAYFTAKVDNQKIGYMALIANTDQHQVMLSKLYVAAEFRGTGVGKALLNHAEHFTAKLGLNILWLTVNRNNLHPIEWYQRQGFAIVDEQKKEIGSGFVMDDYIMEKTIHE